MSDEVALRCEKAPVSLHSTPDKIMNTCLSEDRFGKLPGPYGASPCSAVRQARNSQFLQDAVAFVRTRHVPIRIAAAKFGVSKSTLHRALKSARDAPAPNPVHEPSSDSKEPFTQLEPAPASDESPFE